jgi:hypothetical protein
VLEGVRTAASDQSFWIIAAGNVWSWDQDRKTWNPEELPALEVTDTPIGVLPIRERPYLIVRHELMPVMFKPGEDFHSDTIMGKGPDGIWKETPNRLGGPFFAEQWTAGGDAAWICTREGVLLRVTPDAIEKTEAPAECDALSTDSSGHALALFRDKGVYELGEDWKLVAASSDTSSAEAWAYLARDSATMAFSTTAKSARTHRAHLWLSDTSGLHEVQVP